MKIIYHDDLDGCAAAAILCRFNKIKNANQLIKMNYGEYDKSKISEGDVVYIVDYSFTEPNKDMLDDILKKAKHVYWLDHHISSVNFIKENPEYQEKSNLSIKLDTGKCGAMLTFVNIYSESEIPKFMKLIDVYDRWVKENKLYEDAMAFKLAVESFDFDPLAGVWDKLFDTVDNEDDLTSIVDNGHIIKKYLDTTNDRIAKSMAFESEFEGVECIAINSPGNSTVLGSLMSEYKLGIVYTFDGKEYDYSLYSEDETMDCSVLAKKHNGGGHKGASGCTSKHLLLKKKGSVS